jgi:hypothetical protein
MFYSDSGASDARKLTGTGRLVSIDPTSGIGTAGPVLTGFGSPRADISEALLFLQTERCLRFTTQGALEQLLWIICTPSTSSPVPPRSSAAQDSPAYKHWPSPRAALYTVGISLRALSQLIRSPVSRRTRARTPRAPISKGLRFLSDATLVGARDPLYSINLTTGVATLIGSGTYRDIRGIEQIVGTTSAPEPGPLAPVALALAALSIGGWGSKLRRD